MWVIPYPYYSIPSISVNTFIYIYTIFKALKVKRSNTVRNQGFLWRSRWKGGDNPASCCRWTKTKWWATLLSKAVPQPYNQLQAGGPMQEGRVEIVGVPSWWKLEDSVAMKMANDEWRWKIWMMNEVVGVNDLCGCIMSDNELIILMKLFCHMCICIFEMPSIQKLEKIQQIGIQCQEAKHAASWRQDRDWSSKGQEQKIVVARVFPHTCWSRIHETQDWRR